MPLASQDAWDGAADEHHYLNNIIHNISSREYGNRGVDTSLARAESALDQSVNSHARGDYRDAHNRLQVAAEHIGTAAALGEHHDKFYGSSMHPKDAAESEAISYKHGYLS